MTQNAAFKGCGALGITQGDTIYGSAFSNKLVATFDASNQFQFAKTSNKLIVAPFGTTYADIRQPGGYDQLNIYTTDAKTGSLLLLQTTNDISPPYPVTQLATGFAVNKKAGLAALAPSGLAYNQKTDTLYIVDGVNNVVVSFSPMQNLLEKNSVTVLPGGKTFKVLKGVSVTREGRLQRQGAQIAGRSGATSQWESRHRQHGRQLPRRDDADGSDSGHESRRYQEDCGIFGLVAAGTNDSNTVLYYTDANTNTVQLLTK